MGRRGRRRGTFLPTFSPFLSWAHSVLGLLSSPTFHLCPSPMCSNVSVGQSEGGIEWKAPLGTDIFLGSGGGGGGRRGRLGKVPPRLSPPPTPL